ncbi:MAG: hypothetical protein WB757_04115 [Candidatus Cybelea sp.]|jgi:hypothetical protein
MTVTAMGQIGADMASAVLLQYLRTLGPVKEGAAAYGAIVALLSPESDQIAELLQRTDAEHLTDIYPSLVADTAAELGIRCTVEALTKPPHEAQIAIAELVDGLKADLRDRIETNA